jgi:hypothetical protein
MTRHDGELAPTSRLRFVTRTIAAETVFKGEHTVLILQQWWGPNVPSYMVDPSVGEWRDVPLTEEAP